MKTRGKESPRIVKYLFYLFLLLLLGWIGFWGQNSFFKTIKLKRELDALRAKTEELSAINDSLATENQRLKTDPEAAEKAAREQFGLTKPGERVFRFVPAREDGK